MGTSPRKAVWGRQALVLGIDHEDVLLAPAVAFLFLQVSARRRSHRHHPRLNDDFLQGTDVGRIAVELAAALVDQDQSIEQVLRRNDRRPSMDAVRCSGSMTMYEAFFGLREKPFSLLPDPSFLFLSQKHQEALTLLEYGLMNQAGFIVLTGEIGSGKTTLMRYLLHQLDKDVIVGLISHTHQSLGGLMEWICQAFDIGVARGSKLDQHHAFVDFLIDQYAKGKRVLLIVDEAQNLGVEKLEELRLLSNINADKDLVLQVMLLGQPQLRKLLNHPDLEQFVQRIAASYHLGRLTALETEHYIQHRIFVAGGKHEIFTKDACHAVHHYSTGIPRLINLICDTAMVYAYGGSERRITGTAIDEFIASHAPHLLIAIERDEAGRPLPRERLYEEDPPEIDDRTTTAPTLDLVAGPRVDSIEEEVVESPTADDHPGQFRVSPPVAPAAVDRDQMPRPVQSPISQTAGRAVDAAGPGLDTSVADLPVHTVVVGEATKPPPWKKLGTTNWVLLALLLLVATALVMPWLGGSGTNEPVRSAAMGLIQGDRSKDQKGIGDVDPAAAEQVVRSLVPPSPDPILDRSPAQPERASTPQVSAHPAPMVGGKVDELLASGPTSPISGLAPDATPSEPLRSQRGDLKAGTSDSPLDAPIVAEPGLRSETVSSNTFALAAAPDLQIALPMPAPVEGNPDGVSRSRSANDETPHADTDGGAIDQLERQFQGLSLEVEREADRLVVNLGGSVQFPNGSAELKTTARDTLRRVAELLKDPMTVQVRVIGHTDSSGGEAVNQWLSGLRARAVARYLAANGVSASRLTHQGRGKSEPKVVAEQEQIQGPGINRRVELVVFEPDGAPD